MPWKKGQSGNPKGSPKGGQPGAGRPLDWFREACREALGRSKGLKFMEDLAGGKEFPQLATGEGEVLPLPPSLKERREAVEFLTNRGYGKAEQPIEVNDVSERPTKEDLDAALRRLGVDPAGA